MKIRASVALCITLATVLLTSIFFMTATSSSSSPSGYDPWLDTDDDGDIDFDDIVAMAMIYGTSGTPIDKTALLLELLDRVESLEDRVQALESQTGLPPPDYDSGWVTIPTGYTTFTHNLGTSDVIVYMAGWAPVGVEWGGGTHDSYGGYKGDSRYYGCYWDSLTETEITIWKGSDEYEWRDVRVMMWKMPPA